MADKIKIKCPHCEKKIKIPAKYRGKKVKCPSCEQALSIPGEQKSTSERSEAASSSAPGGPEQAPVQGGQDDSSISGGDDSSSLQQGDDPSSGSVGEASPGSASEGATEAASDDSGGTTDRLQRTRRTQMQQSSGQSEVSIVWAIILTMITCGIYGIFWNKGQMSSVNDMLGEERFGFWSWLLLTIVTFGIYHLYHEYTFAKAINDVQREREEEVNDSLALISLLLSVVGLVIVTDAIQQNEINDLIE